MNTLRYIKDAFINYFYPISTYFSQVPNELLVDICHYLDIDDIYSLNTINPVKIESKDYWIERMKKYKLENYLEYLNYHMRINSHMASRAERRSTRDTTIIIICNFVTVFILFV